MTPSKLAKDLRLFAKYHLKRRVVTYPAREEGLGIVPLDFDFESYVEKIRSYADRFEVRKRDEVEYGQRLHPILTVQTNFDSARRTLLVLAGVHGNEHAGLLAIPDILDRVAGSAQRDVDLCVVTPANPVGAAERSRYNADGFDINRDFRRFETPEARVVREVVEELEPDFIVSLHEGPQDATFMFTNWLVDRVLALRLLDAMERSGTTLADKDYFGRTLSPAGFAPMSATMRGLSMLWDRTLQMKATAMWAGELGIPEITLESSWRVSDREARVSGHVALVTALLDELS